jgi:hypothetical protein
MEKIEKTFNDKLYEIAQRQALYWVEHGTAEEAAQWLAIVFSIEDRLFVLEEGEDEEGFE